MKLFLCTPRGFCAGVKRAIEIVELALKKWKKVYVYNQIVHNKHVVDRLKKKGAIFTDDITKVPENSYLIYSAHGVAPKTRLKAKKRNLIEIDATCPLVEKNHFFVKKYARLGYKILLIGHKNHIEVIGVASEVPLNTYVIEGEEDIKNLPIKKDQKIFCLAQTTLNVEKVEKIIDKLKEKFSNIETLKRSSICYATTNRQAALKKVLSNVDLTLIIGDPRSSNSNRLKEVSLDEGIPSYLINSSSEIKKDWLKKVSSIALTAGASTPENIVQECVERLKILGVKEIKETPSTLEEVTFKIPKILLRTD